MVVSYLGRGLVAGLLAGLLAGLFAFFVGEPLLDRAIALEEKAEAAHTGVAHAHMTTSHQHESGMVQLSRKVQKVGLFFATGLSGSFLGGLFGLAFAFFRGRLRATSDWARSLSLASALFAGVALLPFLKYPANPPGVGSPSTIGSRTTDYFAMVALSLLVVVLAWYASNSLRQRGVSPPIRQVAVGVSFVILVGLLFVGLPAPADPGEFPAGLLWDYRLVSLGTLALLWTGLAVFFGALCERANRKDPSE